MITGKDLINEYQKMYSENEEIQEEKLYSTGDDYLDDLLEKAFCEGYEYAQREFADFSGNSADYKLKMSDPNAWVKSRNTNFNTAKRSLYGLDGTKPTIGGFKSTNKSTGAALGTQSSTNFNKFKKPVNSGNNMSNLSKLSNVK